jgi:lipid-binding SYLF domain-containing protein
MMNTSSNPLLSRRTMMLGASMLAGVMISGQAMAATDAQQVVDRARITIEDLRKDKEFGNARDLKKRARAVLIIPRLYKGGFFVGGEGGTGVLLTHGAGGWSQPAFYYLGSASFGLQIGLEQAEMIMFIMSQKALDALYEDQFKIGANAGITVVTLGSNVEGATTSNVGADIVTWASSSGAYAGISLNGSVIKPDNDDNRAFYGKPATPRNIHAGKGYTSTGAAGLRQSLTTIR